MDKKNKIILGCIIAFTIIIIVICVLSIKKHNNIQVGDAVLFKEEYESLNGLVNEKNEKIYPKVEISLDNPIIYKSDEEIINVLENETAIIYFGFKSCPWCRSMIETLLKVAKDNNLSTIYYVNIYDIRDSYVISDDNNIEKIKDGTAAYNKILKFMGEKLSEYYLEDIDGNKIDTKTTRLYAPTVIAVKNGKLKYIHEGTVEDQTDPYEPLTEDQKNKLYNDFQLLYESIYTENVCKTSDGC